MFYGWIILAALSSVYFFAVGTVVYGFSVIIPEMIKDMGWSRSEASLGFSILVLLLGLLGPVAAILLHRFGARKIMGAVEQADAEDKKAEPQGAGSLKLAKIVKEVQHE